MTTQKPTPPVTKYELTFTIRGNSHDEIVSELLAATRGGYLLSSDYYRRDEFHSTSGRETMVLRHTNPEQTPENYRRELEEWFEAAKAFRSERGGTDD